MHQKGSQLCSSSAPWWWVAVKLLQLVFFPLDGDLGRVWELGAVVLLFGQTWADWL